MTHLPNSRFQLNMSARLPLDYQRGRRWRCHSTLSPDHALLVKATKLLPVHVGAAQQGHRQA